MDGKDLIQFELWKDCTQGCKFCFNKPWWKTTYCSKIQNLRICKETLNNTEIMKNYSYLGFIGGELFSNMLNDAERDENGNLVYFSRVKYMFYEVIDKAIELLNEGKLQRIQFTSNLLNKTVEIEDNNKITTYNKNLFEFLYYINKKSDISKWLLCTSYDLKYRFKSEEEERLWSDTMLKIHRLYPTLQLHVETVLTQFFLEAVLNEEFDITKFQIKYNCYFDVADVHTGYGYNSKFEMQKDIPDFFPKRETFLQFLQKVFEEKILHKDNICHFGSMANTLYFPRPPEFTGNNSWLYERKGREERLPYGQDNKADYIDSDKHIIDDISYMWETINYI